MDPQPILASEDERQDDSFALNQDLIIDESKGFDNFSTIDCVKDSLDTNNRNNQAKLLNYNLPTSTYLLNTLISSSRSWVCLLLIGILIGSIAALLTIVTEYLNNIKTGYCSTNFYLNRNFCCWEEDEELCGAWKNWTSFGFINYLIFVSISISLALAAGLTVKYYAPFAAGSGISEIKCIVSGFAMPEFLNWPTLLVKAIGLPLTIASGLSVGKEGPSVHYAVAAGYCIANLFKKYRQKQDFNHLKEYLIASSAAGVAVAFGSPIGGVLFSIEEIASNFQLSTLWKSYFCSLVAVSTLAFINPFRTGQLVMFEVQYDESWHSFEIPIFIILGIFGGIYGIIVSEYNILVVGFRKKFLKNYAIKELFILSSITALICYFNEFLRLDMTESMEILFHECGVGFEHRLCNIEGQKLKTFLSLIVATILRMLFTIISYGCKIPCGIFVPSMAAGATFGRAIGIIVENFNNQHPNSFIFNSCSNDKQCITPGTYAFLGAAAALSGITDLTVTVVVIMFELTGALRYILPTMIVVGTTKIINDKWGKGAIADQMISFNGLPFIDPKEEHVFNLTTEFAMTTKTFVIPTDKPVQYSFIKKLLEDPLTFRDIPVVESLKQPHLIGHINRKDLLLVLSHHSNINSNTLCDFITKNPSLEEENVIFLENFINHNSLTVYVNTSLEESLEIFFKLSPRTLFVINESGELKGILTKKDIIKFERYFKKLEENQFNINKIKKIELDKQNENLGNLIFQKLQFYDNLIMSYFKRH